MENLLHQAVCDNDVKALHELLEGGADPNALDDNGKTPLMYAANLRSLRNGTVGLLLKAGADVACVTPQGENFFQFLLEKEPGERGSSAVQLSEKFDLLRLELNRYTCYDVIEPIEGVPYTGRILAVNDEYALCIQNTKHEIVLHDTSRLERVPEPGDFVKISYGLFNEPACVRELERECVEERSPER